MDFRLFTMLNQLGLLNHCGVSGQDRHGPFKGPGHLGIPKPALEQVDSSHGFQARVFSLFSELTRARESVERLLSQPEDSGFSNQPRIIAMLSEFAGSNEPENALLSELHADPRIAALKGKMISTGSGATIFEESRLAMWYLWCANEFGPEAAKGHLGCWLEADEVEVVNTLWVHGLDLDEEVELEDGYRISPAVRLPDSTHKEQALQFKMPSVGEVTSFPTVAITRICRVKKTCPADGIPDPGLNADFWKAQQRLYDIAITMNILPGVSCLPVFATSYSLPTDPYGPFSGSGGGISIYDVIGRRQTKITKEHGACILAALHDFSRLTHEQQERFRRILGRLSQGKRRFEIEDKILDLGIALEMLLLKDNQSREQLALSFRLRGAWLVSDAREERLENYRLLKDLYNYRSQVAHSGLLEDGKPGKIEQVRKKFPAFQALAETICRRLLSNPSVDWDSLIVGGAGGDA